MAAFFARSGLWRFLTLPLVALPLWLLDYYLWHVPAVYDAALGHQTWLIHVEHACYFATGILVWWPLVQDVPRRLASGARAGYAFAAFVLASPLGLLLALLPKPIYPFYEHVTTRVWGLGPLADQQIAGVTMASEQAVLLFVRLRVLVPPLPRRGRRAVSSRLLQAAGDAREVLRSRDARARASPHSPADGGRRRCPTFFARNRR